MSAAVDRLRDGEPLVGFAVVATGHFLTDLVHLVRCLALDDGGYVAPAVLRRVAREGAPQHAGAGTWVGLVEQTTSGIYRLRGRSTTPTSSASSTRTGAPRPVDGP